MNVLFTFASCNPSSISPYICRNGVFLMGESIRRMFFEPYQETGLNQLCLLLRDRRLRITEMDRTQVFGKMFEKGHIFRGRKPVNWSPSSRTALAEAELEYPPGHTSTSVYAAFQVCRRTVFVVFGYLACLLQHVHGFYFVRRYIL